MAKCENKLRWKLLKCNLFVVLSHFGNIYHQWSTLKYCSILSKHQSNCWHKYLLTAEVTAMFCASGSYWVGITGWQCCCRGTWHLIGGGGQLVGKCVFASQTAFNCHTAVSRQNLNHICTETYIWLYEIYWYFMHIKGNFADAGLQILLHKWKKVAVGSRIH